MTEIREFIDFDNFVARVPSNSVPGKNYIVKRMLGQNECDCDGFKYRGYCRHFSELLKDPILQPLRDKVDELLGKKNKEAQKMHGRRIPLEVLNKVVGHYYPDIQVYVKGVDFYRHRSVIMGGWAIQKPLVEHLRKLGCQTVRMDVTKSGERFVLYTVFKNYLEHGVENTLNPLDGPQIFLRDEHWKRKKI